MLDYKECKRQVALVNGFPPYNDSYNPCRGDGYLYQSIVSTYPPEMISKALEELKMEANKYETNL